MFGVAQRAARPSTACWAPRSVFGCLLRVGVLPNEGEQGQREGRVCGVSCVFGGGLWVRWPLRSSPPRSGR